MHILTIYVFVVDASENIGITAFDSFEDTHQALAIEEIDSNQPYLS